MISLDELTLEEVEIIETKAGVGISVFGDDDAPKAKLMAAIIYVVKKREDPKFKFEDAKRMTMKEATELLGKERN